jgi:hypothetical protein
MLTLPISEINIDIDIFVNCSWVDTRWNLHTNNTKDNTTTLVGRLLGFEPRVVKIKLTMN